jgi:carbon-monoxide dehydrogenase medium subunit
VIPPAFDYARPSSVDEAIQLLSTHGDEAKVLAGGQSLIPLLRLRLAQPSLLVDVERVPGLEGIRVDGDQVVIGAMTRHRDVERSPILADEVPLLAAATARVGDPQVRNRGTLGGALAHGDAASDLPAAVLALGGSLVAVGPAGRREIPVDEFYLGFLEMALAPDELLVEVRLPRRAPGAGWSFQKFARRAQDWAVVGCAVAHRSDGTVGIGMVNMGATPTRSRAAEAALRSGAPVDEAAALAADGMDPPEDVHASAEYRRHLARVLVGRALREANGSGGPADAGPPD